MCLINCAFNILFQINKNKLQRFCVVPKMEYLTEYGAQCFTQSELTRQWISLHVRPETDLYRGMSFCFAIGIMPLFLISP
jgi:hypothetical protein